MSKGIFHDLIVEEYEKRVSEKIDVVGIKRATFKDLLKRANECFEVNEYEKAKELYNQLLKLFDTDPYPDEYALEEDTLFYIKCCFFYSNIYNYKNVDDTNKISLISIEQCLLTLIESYPNKIMPYYLKLLLDSKTSNNLSSIFMCILIQTVQYQNSKHNVIPIENTYFNKLLPTVEQIMEFQQKMFKTTLEILNKSDVKKVLKLCKTCNKSKNMAVQTDKPKMANKYLQTDLKTFRNMEVQVNLDVCEKKKRIYDLERTYRETVVMHNKSLRELQMQIDANNKEHQKVKEEMGKQLEAYRNEITQLKETISACQAETASETRKNENLQRFILDLVEQKFALRKQLHESIGEKSNYMITYLAELLPFLSTTTIPSDTTVRNEMEYWNMQLLVNNRHLENLISTYKSDKSRLIQSSCSETCTSSLFKNWPDVPQCLRDSESVIFKSLKLLLNQVIELETKLQEMRNNYKGFLNYANSQCESPWVTNKRKCQSTISDLPLHVGINPFLPIQNCSAINPGVHHLSAMHVSTAHPPMEWLNHYFSTIHNHQEVPGSYQTTVAINPQLNARNSTFSLLQPANSANRIPSGNFHLGYSQLTNAHPGPLSTPYAGPIQNIYGNADLNGNNKKRKDRVSTSPNATTGEQASTSSVTSVNTTNTMQNSSRNGVLSHNAAAVPGPSHMCVSHPTLKIEAVSDEEVTTSDGAVGGGSVHDDKVLFHYIYENCPGFTEERITLAMLKALDEFGGSFDNVPRQRVLNSTKVYLHTTPMFFDDISEQCCTICFEENSKSPLHTLPCQHIYHRRCIKMWLKRSGCCPICRKPTTFVNEMKK